MMKRNTYTQTLKVAQAGRDAELLAMLATMVRSIMRATMSLLLRVATSSMHRELSLSATAGALKVPIVMTLGDFTMRSVRSNMSVIVHSYATATKDCFFAEQDKLPKT